MEEELPAPQLHAASNWCARNQEGLPLSQSCQTSASSSTEGQSLLDRFCSSFSFFFLSPLPSNLLSGLLSLQPCLLLLLAAATAATGNNMCTALITCQPPYLSLHLYCTGLCLLLPFRFLLLHGLLCIRESLCLCSQPVHGI